jgi:PAS domain S-box-containing protein
MNPSTHKTDKHTPPPELADPYSCIQSEHTGNTTEFNDAKYRQIFESFEDLYYEIDMAENIRVLSPSVYSLTGWLPEELIGRPVRDIYLNPQDRNPLLEALLTDGSVKNFIVVLKKKDGSAASASVNASIMLDSKGNPTGISGTIRDMSELFRTQKALQESEEKFRTLAESSPFAIMIYQNDKWIYTNPAGEKICGYSSEELYSLNFWDFIHPDDLPVVQSRGKARQGGQQAKNSYEFRIIAKGGIEKWVVLTGASITYEGQSAGLISVFDISDRKRVEEEKAKLDIQLQQFQKNEALGTLAGGIAHDFNNLLMGIQGRASLLSMDMETSNPHWKHIHAIEEYIRSATNLTKQLLGLARGGKYEIKPIDMNELVLSSSAMFGRTKKEIHIYTQCHPSPLVVEADRGQIDQVLLNMYVNAWQAMPPGGGELRLETKIVTLDETFCKPHQTKPGRYALISITDTGSGMDEATRQRIFDPFFTTKEMGRGTGLGLASAYGIIKNHCGMITVYSEIGHGTTFNIFLPVSDKAAHREVPLEAGLIKGSATILLIDDEELIIDVGQAMLEYLGYNVMVCKGGREAVEVITDMGNEIDLVILDMIMPGMDGGTTFDRIREIQPVMPVLLSSGYAINGHADEIMRRGCNGFIQKPYDISELSLKIRKILDETKGSSQQKLSESE